MKTRTRMASRRRGVAGSKQTQMLQAAILANSAQTSQYANTLAARIRALRVAAVSAKMLAVLGAIAAVALLVRYLWPSVIAANGGTTGGGSNTPGGGTGGGSNMPNGETNTQGGVTGFAFSDFDHNGDGKISEDEVRAELESRGFRPTDQELHVIMTNSDADSSGAVGTAEFDKLVSEVQKVTAILTPLLPWWAYLLILIGVLCIMFGILWYAWRSSNWMMLFWAIFGTGIVISILESQLYGVVFGQYVAGLGAGLIAFTYFLRYMKRTFIDPLAKLMKEKAEWLKTNVDELTKNVGAMSEYVTGKADAAVNVAKEATQAVADLGETSVEAADALKRGITAVAKGPHKPLQKGLYFLDTTIGPKGLTNAEIAGRALQNAENALNLPLGYDPDPKTRPSSFVQDLMKPP